MSSIFYRSIKARLYGHLRQLHGTGTLADDFSILDARWR